ncbi:hypothetical protein RB653_008281 [Dictyostelium firmibasis]|uniref:GATOR complex protein WDR24 n=1 Tax=Dictyostelium firmibasis TaxID=79012 RepID=A0AAN7TSJ1_9MYCE
MSQMNQPPNKCQTYLNLGSPLSAISSSPDSTKLIVAGRDIVKIVSVQNNEFKVTSNLRAGKTQSLNYTGNDCCWHPSLVESYRFLIATAATNGAVVIWNTVREGSKSVERIFTDHSRAVNKLAWHPDKLDCILTGSQDNTLRMWDIRDSANASKITFSPKSESIRDVQFNPSQSNQFAAAFDNGTIQLWDIRKPTIAVEKITSHQGLVLTIDWHPEEKNIIASGGRDRAIRVWDFSNGKSLNNVSTISSVSRIKWRPGNKWHIASCSSIVDFQIHIWDVKKPYIPLFSFTDHRDVPTGLIWKSPSSLISCSKDSHLLLNDFQDSYKPYQHIRTSGLTWNVNNEIASINDKINRTQSNESLPSLSTQFPSFFASFNVPTPPPLPPLVKVEQGIMKIYSPKYQNSEIVYNERYLFEHFASNYRFRGQSFNQLCDHNQLVSQVVNQHHISTMWSLLKLHYSNLDQIEQQKEQIEQQKQELQKLINKKSIETQKKQKQQLRHHKNIKEQQFRDIENLEKESNPKKIIKDIGDDDNDSANQEINLNKEEDEEMNSNFDDSQMGDIFDPSNDMMTAKEPPTSSLMEFNANDTGNDQFCNILSAEAVTPLVSLPTTLERQKSDNILDNLGSGVNIKKQNQPINSDNMDSLDKKNNKSTSNENKDSSINQNQQKKNHIKDKINYNNKDNISDDGDDDEEYYNDYDVNNNNRNGNNKENYINYINYNNFTHKNINENKKNDNYDEMKSNDEDSDSLKIMVPCFEFEEFSFQPIITDMLEACIEKGDVQTCVFIVLILGKYVDLNIEKHRLTTWFGSYIELLQRYKMWSLALEIMKYCDDQIISQASKRHTTLISACSTCGKSIPQNSILCEKCNKASSKCSICRLPVKGMWVWCQGCGHGGHLEHMKSWFVDKNQKSCPTGCAHICTPFKK